MKFNLLILLGIAVFLNQSVLGFHYGFNPFRNDGALYNHDEDYNYRGYLYNSRLNYRVSDPCDDFNYRGFNTYNFNNYLPLHYGLFSEEDVQELMQRCASEYLQSLTEDEADVNEDALAYKVAFNEANPSTYQDWYGLSRYYPAGYNSYRLY